MTLQDDERRRIARELHEGLGQELVAAKMMVDRMNLRDPSIPLNEQMRTRVSAILESSVNQIRSLSHVLHPPLLDEVGLCSAVTWYVNEMTKLSAIEASLNIHPPDFPRVDEELEIVTFRIVQEALANVVRHSGASQVSIALVAEPNSLTVGIRDNGRGIENNKKAVDHQGTGVGIVAMRQRAKELGGELRLQNTSPGTLVEVTLPLDPSRRSESRWCRHPTVK